MATTPAWGQPPLSVLVVDDDELDRARVCRALEALGHEAEGVADEDAAWSRFLAERVDLLLLACPRGVPVSPLVARVRDRQHREGVGHVFVAAAVPPGRDVTGNGSAPAARRAAELLEAGADAWLSAPVDPAWLPPLVAQARRTLDVHAALQAQREEAAAQRAEIAAQRREIAARDARLHEELRRDPQTGLGNRVRLDEDLRRIRAGAARYGHRCTAVLLDVDQCRRFGEACGRAALDALVAAVADVIRASLRDGDAAYRLGDDRFLVLLPEQGEDGAVVVAERCRASVAALAVPHPRNEAADHVTLSAGVAELRGGTAEAVEDWLRRADGALYAAKAAGRNGIARDDHTRVLSWDRRSHG